MTNNPRYLLIVNPNSGAGNHVKKISMIKKYFKKFKADIAIKYTGYKGHAEIIARESVGTEYDAVIGCGGDGTINEVVNGLAGSGMKMGIIPWGTGNVFVREMKFPKRLKKICRIILKGKHLKIDTGSCNNRLFLLMASVGFDAYSLKQIKNSFMKKNLGIIAYALGALKAFFNYKFPELEVKPDNALAGKGTFVLVSNTSRYGRYFRITPYADPFDGKLDVIVYRKKGRLNFLKLLFGILWNTLTGNHENNHYFFSRKNGFYRVTSLKITSASGKMTYQLDGDHFTSDEITIEIKKKSLNVILPKKIIKKYIKRKSIKK